MSTSQCYEGPKEVAVASSVSGFFGAALSLRRCTNIPPKGVLLISYSLGGEPTRTTSRARSALVEVSAGARKGTSIEEYYGPGCDGSNVI